MSFDEVARASIVLDVKLNDAQIGAAAQRAAQKFNDQFQKSADALKNFGAQGNRTGQIIGGLSIALAAVGAAAVKVGINFAKTAGDFQELEQSLNAIIKNSATANTTTAVFIGQLRKLALESGRSSLLLANTGRQFLALGFSGAKAVEVLTAFTKAASLTGASNEQLRLALNGVAQIASKGAVAMEELRRQIAENLPGAVNLARFFEIVGENLDITTAAARKLQEQGLLTADEGIKALTQTLNEATESIDVFALRASTLNGQLGILREFFTQIVQTRFRPFLDALIPVLKSFSDGLKDGQGPLESIGKNIEELAKVLGEALAKALKDIAPLIPGMIDLFVRLAKIAIPIASTLISLASAIGTVLIPVLQGLAIILDFITTALGKAGTAGLFVAGIIRVLGTSFAAFGRFLPILGRFAGGFGTLGATIGKFAGPIGLAIGFLIQFIDLIKTAPAAMQEFTNGLQHIIDFIPGMRGFASDVGAGFRFLVDELERLLPVADKIVTVFTSGEWDKGIKNLGRLAKSVEASNLAANANKFLSGLSDKLTAVADANDDVASAARSLTSANQSLANATQKLRDLEAERAVLLNDTARDLREIVEAEEALTRIRFRLRDIGQEEVEIQRELNELRTPASADDLAEADRNIERAKLALNKALRDEQALLAELNEDQKISVNLAGLSLDQLRTKLAGIRASLALQRANNKAADTEQTLAEKQTEARLDVGDAQQTLNDRLAERTALEETVKNNAIKIRELEERLLELSLDRAGALRDESAAQRELNALRAGDTARTRELKVLEEQIAGAKQAQATAAQGVRDAENDVTAAKFKQQELLVAARGFEAEINALLVTRLATMKLLTQEQALAAATNLVATLPGFSLPAGVSGPTSSPASALQIAQEIADALLNNPNALRTILARFGITNFASGGLVTRPTFANIGERFKPEIVLPLTKPDRVWSLLSANLPKYPGALAAAQSAIQPSSAARSAIKMPTSGQSSLRRGDGPMTHDQATEIIQLLKTNGKAQITVEAPITVSSPVEDPRFLARKIEQQITSRLR